ncbi:MAG: rhodanese-like domain-containing protein [Deltaproteobacteria bacterium]|nr:rhodanese-like domain-containing protein [Deltaproteobacteria bacterium]
MTPWIIIGVVVALFLLLKMSQRPDIDGAAAARLAKEGALLLDVRSANEFSVGSLPGARNISVHDLQKRMAEVGPKERGVVVFCLSGSRSAVAAKALKAAGYTKVHNLGAMARYPR